jgi:integrase
MAAGTGEQQMTVFQKGKRWVAQVHDSATGKARHVGTFDTRREAIQAEARAFETRVSKIETVGSFTARWTTDFPRLQPSTNKHNAERIRKFADAYKARRMDSITRQQARAWALEHPGEHSALRAMFADALRDDIINANPFADLGIRKKTPKRRIDPDWMSQQNVHDLAEAAYLVHKRGTADIVSNAIIVAAYTGIRPGELFALELSDVRVDELLISRAVQSRTNTIGPPKNGQSRVITLPRVARLAIENTPRNHEKLVFTSPTGRQLYQSNWHQLWNPVRVAAGREAMHFYELRHWCATHLLELGLSPSDVAVQLGHTDGGILVQTVYGHPSEVGARERILNRINEPQPVHSRPQRKAQ